MSSKKRLQTLPTELGSTAVAPPQKSPLWGRTAVFIGDSITHNKFEQLKDPTTAGWPGRIGTSYAMQWCNLGIGGATVTTDRANNTSVQLDRAIRDGWMPDLLILQGGINDAYSGATLGEIEDGFAPDSFDARTFSGSLQNLLARAKEAYPSARLFYILHHTTPNAKRLDDLSLPNLPKGEPPLYIERAREILEKWSIPYLDLYNDERFNTEIFATATNATGCMFPDLLHVSSPVGYDTLTPYIIAWMERVLLDETV